MTRLQQALIGISLVAHLGAYSWMGKLPKERKSNPVAIALAESKKKKDEAKKELPPPPPPPHIEKRSESKAKIAPSEPKDLAPPPIDTAPPPSAGDGAGAMDGFADLGLTMGGGGPGLAVPTGHGGGGPRPAPTATTKKQKVLASPKSDGCSEDVVKAKLSRQVQPAYSAEGRQANVEGVVKLEITIDENGNVASVRVIKGLGFGLDEAAITAAKQWTFTPATRCGRAVVSTLKPGVRFQLGS